MSGTASVPNTFASVTTATGAQLDANNNTIVAYINDPTNRNNFVADTGTTNTVVLTFVPPVVGGYTSGIELTWKWANTNSGAVVLNANGLGNINLVNPDGTNLQQGQGVAGSIGKAVYDGTRAIYITGFATPASASQVSAAVTLVPYVSPGRMQNHPGVAKAWAQFNGTATGTITAGSSYNVATIVKAPTATYSVALTTPMANTAYVVIGGASAVNIFSVVAGSKTTAGFSCATYSSSAGTPNEITDVSFMVYGTQ